MDPDKMRYKENDTVLPPSNHLSNLFERTCCLTGGHMLPNLCHPGGKGAPVLSQLNGLHGCAQDSDTIPSQHPGLGQLHTTVQRCLAPEGQ